MDRSSKIVLAVMVGVFALLIAINLYLNNQQKPVELPKPCLSLPRIDTKGMDKSGNVYYYNSEGKKKYRVYID
jgi:hypothetical protein